LRNPIGHGRDGSALPRKIEAEAKALAARIDHSAHGLLTLVSALLTASTCSASSVTFRPFAPATALASSVALIITSRTANLARSMLAVFSTGRTLVSTNFAALTVSLAAVQGLDPYC
jgi:hypothetical protein